MASASAARIRAHSSSSASPKPGPSGSGADGVPSSALDSATAWVHSIHCPSRSGSEGPGCATSRSASRASRRMNVGPRSAALCGCSTMVLAKNRIVYTRVEAGRPATPVPLPLAGARASARREEGGAGRRGPRLSRRMGRRCRPAHVRGRNASGAIPTASRSAAATGGCMRCRPPRRDCRSWRMDSGLRTAGARSLRRPGWRSPRAAQAARCGATHGRAAWTAPSPPASTPVRARP